MSPPAENHVSVNYNLLTVKTSVKTLLTQKSTVKTSLKTSLRILRTKSLKMTGNQMTSEELMKFMMNFKDTIEKTMNGIGKDINKKIDEKLTNLDRGLENLSVEVRANDAKQEENNKKLEARLKKLEIDAGRQRYSRTKLNSNLGWCQE